MLKSKILAALGVGEKHDEGWYVDCEWMTRCAGKDAKSLAKAGPFLAEADAVAFKWLNSPDEPTRRHGGVHYYTRREVAYLVEHAGEEKGVAEVRMLLPSECRLVVKGWEGRHTPERVAWLLEDARVLCGS